MLNELVMKINSKLTFTLIIIEIARGQALELLCWAILSIFQVGLNVFGCIPNKGVPLKGD